MNNNKYTLLELIQKNKYILPFFISFLIWIASSFSIYITEIQTIENKLEDLKLENFVGKFLIVLLLLSFVFTYIFFLLSGQKKKKTTILKWFIVNIFFLVFEIGIVYLSLTVTECNDAMCMTAFVIPFLATGLTLVITGIISIIIHFVNKKLIH